MSHALDTGAAGALLTAFRTSPPPPAVFKGAGMETLACDLQLSNASVLRQGALTVLRASLPAAVGDAHPLRPLSLLAEQVGHRDNARGA